MAVQTDKSLTLTPGNWTLSESANDPTVLCLHNPYQPKCRQGHIDWPREQEYYHKSAIYQWMGPKSTIGRLSCADFYNKTDGQPLCWQMLRQIDLSAMRSYIANQAGSGACSVNNNIAEFYIYWQTGTVKKYVEWYQGWQLQYNAFIGKPFIAICYSDDRSEEEAFFMIEHLFRDCLRHYGDITENHGYHRSPFYAHDGFTDTPNQTTIKPMSRPSSKFDYDPSVSCEDNPNPPPCKSWPKQRYIHYDRIAAYANLSSIFIDAHRVSCLDFYNQSDGKLLWWQSLRQAAIFYPIKVAVQLNSDNACQNHTVFDFYLHNRSNVTTSKYEVEWERGVRLCKKKENKANVMNLCYADNPAPMPDNIQRMVGYSFQECLLYYGQLADLVVNSPVAPNRINTP